VLFRSESNKSGYYSDQITDKSLYTVCLKEFSGTPVEGAIRTSTTGLFQVYLNGRWNNVVINFSLLEDGSFGYTFEHQPVGFLEYIEIMSGNSLNNLGLNGKPITQGYQTSMGPYPIDPIIDGGIF
jgi:hypothetical protein